MENEILIIMLKDIETGFLDKEFTSIKLFDDDFINFIYKIYAENISDKLEIKLMTTINKDIEDWEYNAIFDYYDFNCYNNETFSSFNTSIKEVEDSLNPIWEISIKNFDNDSLEDIINKILDIHKREVISVYEAIADKKDDYID